LTAAAVTASENFAPESNSLARGTTWRLSLPDPRVAVRDPLRHGQQVLVAVFLAKAGEHLIQPHFKAACEICISAERISGLKFFHPDYHRDLLAPFEV
jgi:hypothetical protein